MIKIIGGGLAGAEAAYQIVKRGGKVTLYDMKPDKMSPAHKSKKLGELVCSNSLKSDDFSTASGLLKYEMRQFGSLILTAAEHSRVAAGGALAVDRDLFAEYIDNWLKSQPNIKFVVKEIDKIDDEEITIVATGPLTSDKLSVELSRLCGERLYFFDAAAPIVTADSIDCSKTFLQGRYEQNDDYVNCPLTKEEYEIFVTELVKAERAELNSFDKREYYESCMPVEVMAERGFDTLRFGMLKPVGLVDPITNKRPYAAVQLRAENLEKTAYNIVGFQTNLKFAEQNRVFGLIPALKNAEIVRYGVMHRNTYIDAPKLLDADFSLKEYPKVFIAGQLSGVEGYMESAMSGLIAGIAARRLENGEGKIGFPPCTMMGAITRYITSCESKNFQPINANFGIMPPLDDFVKDKKARKTAYSNRALKAITNLRETI